MLSQALFMSSSSLKFSNAKKPVCNLNLILFPNKVDILRKLHALTADISNIAWNKLLKHAKQRFCLMCHFCYSYWQVPFIVSCSVPIWLPGLQAAKRALPFTELPMHEFKQGKFTLDRYFEFPNG
jgi:hypothetical protein